MGLVTSAGCPAGESERCRTLCKTVVACVDKLNEDSAVIDENECTVTCTSLDRDPEGKTQVDAYAECMSYAADCQAKLACKSAPAPIAPPSADERRGPAPGQ